MFHTDHGKINCNVDVKEQGTIVLLQSLNGNKKAEKAVSNLAAEMLAAERCISFRKSKTSVSNIS